MVAHLRHSGGSRNPVSRPRGHLADRAWTPAFAGVTILALAALGGFATSCSSPKEAEDVPGGPEVFVADGSEGGETTPAPAFPVSALTACDGTPIDLGGAAATWIVLTAGDCPSCKDQLPFVASFAAQWAPLGVRVVVVLGDDAEGSGHVSAAYCQAFRADFGLPCPVARDDGFGSLGAFAGSATPVQLILDDDLTIRARAAGWDEGFHPGWIEGQVRAVLDAR